MSQGTQFYRCMLCSNVVSKWDIHEHHGCSRCGNTRIRPSDLSWWEKIVQVLKHPKVWAW